MSAREIVRLSFACANLVECVVDKCKDEVAARQNAKLAKLAKLANNGNGKPMRKVNDDDDTVAKTNACMANKCKAALMTTLEALRDEMAARMTARSAHGMQSLGIENMLSTIDKALKAKKSRLSTSMLEELRAMLGMISPLFSVL